MAKVLRCRQIELLIQCQLSGDRQQRFNDRHRGAKQSSRTIRSDPIGEGRSSAWFISELFEPFRTYLVHYATELSNLLAKPLELFLGDAVVL